MVPYRPIFESTRRRSMHWIVLTAAVAFMTKAADAQQSYEWTVDVAASSAVFDRGEQIGGETVEFSAGMEVALPSASVYTSFYRLLPVGNDQKAFDDEADYALGVIINGDAMIADLSANLLTYPGESAEHSLELLGIFNFDAPLAPGVIAFHDVEFEDWGLEAFVEPSWNTGDWTHHVLLRAGFVSPGDISATRSYVGMELGTSRLISDTIELGLFARADADNRSSFVRDIENGAATRMRSTGVAAGISLSVSGSAG